MRNKNPRHGPKSKSLSYITSNSWRLTWFIASWTPIIYCYLSKFAQSSFPKVHHHAFLTHQNRTHGFHPGCPHDTLHYFLLILIRTLLQDACWWRLFWPHLSSSPWTQCLDFLTTWIVVVLADKQLKKSNMKEKNLMTVHNVHYLSTS